MSTRGGQNSFVKDIFRSLSRRCFAYGFLALIAYIASVYTLESAEAAGDGVAVSVLTHMTTWFGMLSLLMFGVGLFVVVLLVVVVTIVEATYREIRWFARRRRWI